MVGDDLEWLVKTINDNLEKKEIQNKSSKEDVSAYEKYFPQRLFKM